MKLTLWIFIIMISLSMILTVQAGRSTEDDATKDDANKDDATKDDATKGVMIGVVGGSKRAGLKRVVGGSKRGRSRRGDSIEVTSSFNPDKSCREWIYGEGFTDNFPENKISAWTLVENTTTDLDEMNIWPRGYSKALALSSRTESLLPGPFCELFGQKESDTMPNITPGGSSIVNFKRCPEWISYSGYDLTDSKNNFLHLQLLIEEGVYDVLSNCALRYGVFINKEHEKQQAHYTNPGDFCMHFLRISPNTNVSFKNCLVPFVDA